MLAKLRQVNIINYKGRLYQILPTETRFGFAKAKLEVQKRLEGTIHIFYKGEELPSKPIVPVEDEQSYAPSSNGSFTGRGMTFSFYKRVT